MYLLPRNISWVFFQELKGPPCDKKKAPIYIRGQKGSGKTSQTFSLQEYSFFVSYYILFKKREENIFFANSDRRKMLTAKLASLSERRMKTITRSKRRFSLGYRKNTIDTQWLSLSSASCVKVFLSKRKRQKHSCSSARLMKTSITFKCRKDQNKTTGDARSFSLLLLNV